MIVQERKRQVLRGSERMIAFLRPVMQLQEKVGCILARTSTGWENPRLGYEAPAYGMTLDFRQRQLHDEDKSCGIQPAYIRVIDRRLSADVLIRVHSEKGRLQKNRK
jgi:hypothetical protein